MLEEKSKVKIFVGYKSPNTIFESNVYQPIITTDVEWSDYPNLIRDNTGINISAKNKNYAELAGHYWVWKNFLPSTESEYIGFCHYRRFLDFNLTPMENVPFKPIEKSDFKKKFKTYTEEVILNCIKDYDIILPHKIYLKAMLYSQYLKWHPEKDMNIALNIIRDNYPQYIETAKLVMSSSQMYSCINFIMKKELLEEYFEWIFNILFKLEAMTDWSTYNDYFSRRTPAYITERFINIWLEHIIKERNLKVLNTSSFQIIGEEPIDSGYNQYLEKYLEQVELINNSQKTED